MPPKKPRRVRSVVLGEGYLKMLEISSMKPSRDGYWPVVGLTRMYPQEGKRDIKCMRILAEIIE